MVNCNPETVSTDADSSDRLYFEPLTVEDVLEVIERERPVGVVAQFGGQTPLRLARRLEEEGVPLLGTPFEAIDVAEDRERFGGVLGELGLQAPAWGIAHDATRRRRSPRRWATRCWCGPPTCWAAARCAICYDEATLRSRPVQAGSLVDRFVEDAIEVDVDASATAPTWIGAGHAARRGGGGALRRLGLRDPDAGRWATSSSGEIHEQTAAIAEALGVRGLINVQFAVQGSADLRDRGQPPRLAHGALRGQGHRPAAGRGGLRAALGLPVELGSGRPTTSA